MAEHESCVGASDEWYTPPEIFDALKLRFDLDPCWAESPHCVVPCCFAYKLPINGLISNWEGLVFMNPPFGGRRGQVPWLEKFIEHGNGVAVVRAYTSSDWWHELVAPCVQGILFPKGKTKFVRGTQMRSVTRNGEIVYPAGSRGEAPGHGIALLGMGEVACKALAQSSLGWYVRNL